MPIEKLSIRKIKQILQLHFESDLSRRAISASVGTSYAQFCHRYKVWQSKQATSMHQPHKVGEKLFVDYCGPTIPVVNPDTGECVNAQIFVAILGTSNYTFACASKSQNQADWINAHEVKV